MSIRNTGYFAAISVILFSACTHLSPVPETFSVYDGSNPKRAVSFDRVVYQIKRVDNEPKADLSFWKVALKERLVKTGYRLAGESDVIANGFPGYLIETVAPHGAVDYNYWVAVFVDKSDLVVIEATGEVVNFKANRAKILAAIQNMDLGKSSGPAGAQSAQNLSR